eukprot:2839300-Alexandrium_andersonii.AAC.1
MRALLLSCRGSRRPGPSSRRSPKASCPHATTSTLLFGRPRPLSLASPWASTWTGAPTPSHGHPQVRDLQVRVQGVVRHVAGLPELEVVAR